MKLGICLEAILLNAKGAGSGLIWIVLITAGGSEEKLNSVSGNY
ncbi:hypothetical protein AB3464_28760 [Pseudomonas asplenii]